MKTIRQRYEDLNNWNYDPFPANYGFYAAVRYINTDLGSMHILDTEYSLVVSPDTDDMKKFSRGAKGAAKAVEYAFGLLEAGKGSKEPYEKRYS